VKLYCRAKGNPAPHITWFKDGNVTKSTGTPHSFDGDQWVLVVKGLVHEDGGFYTCQVKNSAGKISFRYKLNVYTTHVDNQPSIIDYSRGNTTVYEGDQVSLHCTVESKPTPPELKWVRQIHASQRGKYPEEKIIYHNEKYYIFLPLQPMNYRGKSQYLTKYTIMNSRRGVDSGVYICLAMTTGGWTFKEITVNVLPRNNVRAINNVQKEEKFSSMIVITIPCLLILIFLLFLSLYIFWKRKWAAEGMTSSFQINKTTSTIVTSSSTRSGRSSRGNFRRSPLTTYSFSTASPSNRHDYDVIKKSPPSFTTYGHHRRPVLPRYEYSVASSAPRCPAPCPTAYETEASYDASSYEVMTSTTSDYVMPVKKPTARYEPPPPSCRTQSEMTSSCSSLNQHVSKRSKLRGFGTYKKSPRHDDDVRYLTGASTETISDETSSGDVTIGRGSA